MKPDIAIIGAGYVGVPLADVFADAGKNVLLVDIEERTVAALNRGESHIGDVSSEKLKQHVDAGLIAATTDYEAIADADAVLIAPRTCTGQRSRRSTRCRRRTPPSSRSCSRTSSGR